MKTIEVITHPMLYAAIMLLTSIVHSFLKWNSSQFFWFLVAALLLIALHIFSKMKGGKDE